MVFKEKGFTLIEMLVIAGISAVLLVAVGGIMTSSFNAKTKAVVMENVQSESVSILAKLKSNVFEADVNTFVCPVGVGPSIAFTTKSGFETTLLCDITNNKIASISATSGTYNLTSSGLTVRNCDSFVGCTTIDGVTVNSIDFNLDLGVTGGEMGDQFWNFVSKVVVR